MRKGAEQKHSPPPISGPRQTLRRSRPRPPPSLPRLGQEREKTRRWARGGAGVSRASRQPPGLCSGCRRRVLLPFVALCSSVRFRTHKNLKTRLSLNCKRPKVRGVTGSGAGRPEAARRADNCFDFKSRSAAAALPGRPRPGPPRAAESPLPSAPLRLPRAPRPQPPLWSDCLGQGMPPSTRGPGLAPYPALRARTAAPPGGMRPRARILPARARLATFHTPGPGKRRARGSRPSGPPDIPGIAAHNCTFPGQETSPAGQRSAAPPGPPPSPAAGPATHGSCFRRTRCPAECEPRCQVRGRPPATQALRPLRPPGPSWRQVRVVAWARAAHFPPPGPTPLCSASWWVRWKVPATRAPSLCKGFERKGTLIFSYLSSARLSSGHLTALPPERQTLQPSWFWYTQWATRRQYPQHHWVRKAGGS